MSSNNRNNKSQHQHKDLVFFVRVQYRCNSSWQGTIQWMDGKQQKIFRSVLELGNLINSTKNVKSRINLGNNKWNNKESAS